MYVVDWGRVIYLLKSVNIEYPSETKYEFKVTIINFYKHCKLWNLDFLGKYKFTMSMLFPYKITNGVIFRCFHINMLLTHCEPIVGNPRVILIDSLFHHPWVHLVTFPCFQSNMHDLSDLFLLNEITCFVCMLLFCFGGAFFKPT